jgi:hypothetical protein
VREGTGEHGRGDSGRGSRAAFWLAWSLAGLSVAMFLTSVALWTLARGAHVPGNLGVDLTLANGPQGERGASSRSTRLTA